MTVLALSEHQREILVALTRHWELLRWRCNDGSHRWHLGDWEVDGRAVTGLVRRGLLASGGDYAGCPQLVLTDAGKAALS